MIYSVDVWGIAPIAPITAAFVTDEKTACNGCVTDENLRKPASVAVCNGVTDEPGVLDR